MVSIRVRQKLQTQEGESLNPRCSAVLKTVVDKYVETGSPVGSRTVAQEFHFRVSAPTIRNVMAYLEDQGYLTHPHTSAGRVPTDRGYRFYVDRLITETDLLRQGWVPETQDHPEDPESLLESLPQLISQATHYLGVAMVGGAPPFRLQQIRLLRVAQKRCLVILLGPGERAWSRVVEMGVDLPQRELTRFARYLNQELEGLTLREVHRKLVLEMAEDRRQYHRLLDQLLRETIQWIQALGDRKIYLGGLSHLCELPEFAEDVQRLRELFRAFEDKYYMVKILDFCLRERAGEVQVRIGSENPFQEMRHCSIVLSPLFHQGRVTGAIGLIGPTRMDYPRAISVVRQSADWISQTLAQLEEE